MCYVSINISTFFFVSFVVITLISSFFVFSCSHSFHTCSLFLLLSSLCTPLRSLPPFFSCIALHFSFVLFISPSSLALLLLFIIPSLFLVITLLPFFLSLCSCLPSSKPPLFPSSSLPFYIFPPSSAVQPSLALPFSFYNPSITHFLILFPFFFYPHLLLSFFFPILFPLSSSHYPSHL